jgi:hypothetical protein
MPKTQKMYTLGKIKQLVDLNEDITNFDLTFSVTSQAGEEFDAVVVNQTRLDNDENIQYEKAPGTISGRISNDKGVYQNYFLLLKSEAPLQVDVVIDLNEIPKSVETVNQSIPPLIPPRKQSSINWKTMLIFIVMVGGLAMLYYYYTNNKKIPEISQSPLPSLHASPINSSYIKPSPEINNFSLGGRRANESLLSRLNRLPSRE